MEHGVALWEMVVRISYTRPFKSSRIQVTPSLLIRTFRQIDVRIMITDRPAQPGIFVRTVRSEEMIAFCTEVRGSRGTLGFLGADGHNLIGGYHG